MWRQQKEQLQTIIKEQRTEQNYRSNVCYLHTVVLKLI